MGISVRLIKENIDSFTADGEMLLTIPGSLSQEESRSISADLMLSIDAD